MNVDRASSVRLRSAPPIALALVVAWVGTVCGTARAQWTEAVHVAHAAFPRDDVPSALIHAPANFDPSRPLQLVVYLHGYMACTAMLMGKGMVTCRPGGAPLPGRDLAAAHDAAGTPTLLVIPQLAYLKRSGKPGCFARPGCFRAFLEEVLAALPEPRLAGRKALADVTAITLAAHSAGYEAAVAVLRHGEVDALVHDVVLFDALYGEQNAFLAWAAGHSTARLVSLHLRGGRPALNSARLLRDATRKLGGGQACIVDLEADRGSLVSALASSRVATSLVQGAHREVPTRYFARVLRALVQARAEKAGQSPKAGIPL